MICVRVIIVVIVVVVPGNNKVRIPKILSIRSQLRDAIKTPIFKFQKVQSGGGVTKVSQLTLHSLLFSLTKLNTKVGLHTYLPTYLPTTHTFRALPNDLGLV